MRHRNGFTMVELLVVITVIVILMGVLLPALRGIREVARRSKCSHNLREIYGAVQVYADDYRDLLPNAGALHKAGPPPKLPHLHDLLRPYVVGDKPEAIAEEAMRVFHCPSDGPEEFWLKRFGSSYQFRGKDEPKTPDPASGQPFDYYPNPSELGLVRDARGWHRLSRSGSWTLATTMGQQVLFLDGHIEYFGDVDRHAADIW